MLEPKKNMENCMKLIYGVRVIGNDFGEILEKISNFTKDKKEYDDLMKQWTDIKDRYINKSFLHCHDCIKYNKQENFLVYGLELINNANELLHSSKIIKDDFVEECSKEISTFIEDVKKDDYSMEQWTNAKNKHKEHTDVSYLRYRLYMNDEQFCMEDLSLIDGLELYTCIHDTCDNYDTLAMVFIGKTLTKTFKYEIPLDIWGEKPTLSKGLEDIGELGVYLHCINS